MLYKQPLEQEILIAYGRPQRTELPRTLTVCVWNWQKSKQPGWAQEFEELSRVSDLFMAQEVCLSSPVCQTMDKTPYLWNGAVSFFSLKDHFPIGVATGCSVAPLRKEWKRGAREPIFNMPKMTLATLFPIHQAPALLVINIHAINFTRLQPFQENLSRITELLENFNGPVLLAGDFNAWSKKRRLLLQGATRHAGLSEVVFEPDNRTRCLGRPVDYLFVRGLQVLACGVRPTRGSDHNPLLARVQIQ